jgi:hypothetical protein
MKKLGQYPDGTLKLDTTDVRTTKQKLTGKLTFKEKLDLMYPTSDKDITKDWVEYDTHKLFK